jgi:hypothetical protein
MWAFAQQLLYGALVSTLEEIVASIRLQPLTHRLAAFSLDMRQAIAPLAGLWYTILVSGYFLAFNRLDHLCVK